MSPTPALCQSPALLPDAPQPSPLLRASAELTSPAPAPFPNSGPPARPAHHRWRPYLNPGAPVRPLTGGQKLRFWLHLETVPYSPLPSFFAAGYEQVTNDDPKFGTDSGAFGERLGAAFIRDASMRFFVGSLFPVVLHEDPRYFRKATGGIVPRGLYAGEQSLVTRTDSGKVTPNYSDILGRLVASALTLAYYPAPSANARVVADAWATSIAGDAGNNLILEFGPSIARRWRRHRERIRARRSSRIQRSSSIP